MHAKDGWDEEQEKIERGLLTGDFLSSHVSDKWFNPNRFKASLHIYRTLLESSCQIIKDGFVFLWGLLVTKQQGGTVKMITLLTKAAHGNFEKINPYHAKMFHLTYF